jgi:glycosyltransferase involved in cell wall biosynthesis
VKHIALIIPGLDKIGGAERQTLLLAKGLRLRGWRVSVVALTGAGGEAAAELAAEDVAFTSLTMRKGLADPVGWMRMNRWVRREGPDVVHAHLPHAVWLARWSRLAAPVRVLVDTLHSSSTGTLGRWIGYRLSDWLTDKVTAVSVAVAQAHLNAHMVTAAKLAVLPNGVDLTDWKPDIEVRNGFRRVLDLKGKFLWLAAGRLDPVKGYRTLLQAMVDTPEAARLVIAGSGPMEDELKRLSDELGLTDRVQFLGFEPNVRRWMLAANGFVLTSRWEGLPMVVLEAAACEVPTVASDVAGTREVVVDGKTGLLAEEGNAKALAAAMTRMMELPGEERRAMGQRARRFVLERFSLDVALDRWEALYAELLERNPEPRRRGR